MSEPIPFCSVAWGDEFFAKQHWVNEYTAADEDARLAHLINATKVIQTFVKFFTPPDPITGEQIQIFYEPTAADGDENIPDWLKEACGVEVVYLPRTPGVSTTQLLERRKG